MRAATLINRDRERAALLRLADAPGRHLALLTGRRRVGKSFLLTHAWGERPFFFFTASKTTPEINRRQFALELARWSGEDLRPEDYPTWRSAFAALLGVRPSEPLIAVIDEFQYLAEGESGALTVASELNAVWERPAAQHAQRPVLLVLAGSAVSTMQALASGGGPLYGRFAWQKRLRPFGYGHAAEMTPFPALRDRARSYGIFGGTPRYLSAVDAARSLEDNVTRLMLSRSGEVRHLVETALEQEEGLRGVAKYRAVLSAIAAGQTQRNEIAQRAGLSSDGNLRDKLDRLVELGYVETRANVDARPNAPVRYAVADPAFRFYQRFVEPNRSALERYDPALIWAQAVAPHLARYMGREFERIARQGYDRLSQHARGERALPAVSRWGHWEGTDRDRQPVEIDVVAELLGGGTMTGEAEWTAEPCGALVHERHLDKLRRMAASGRSWAHAALEEGSVLLYVSASGFTPDFRAAAESEGHRAVCLSLDDLYR